MQDGVDLSRARERDAQRADADVARNEQSAADTRWLMGDERGRRIVWGQLAEAGVFRTSYTGDGVGTCYNEGQRNAGLRLLNRVMQHTPAEFTLMLQENRTDGR